MKRGSVLDILFIVVIITEIALSAPLMLTVLDGITTQFTAQGHPEAAATTGALRGTIATSIDGSLIFILIATGLVVAFTSAFIISSPIFFVFGLLILIMGVLLSMGLSSAYTQYAGNSVINTAMGSLIMTSTTMNVLPYIVLTIGAIILIMFFAKQGGADTYDA